MRQGSSNLSGSQSALTCLCVCARARLGLREFNSPPRPKSTVRSTSITLLLPRPEQRSSSMRNLLIVKRGPHMPLKAGISDQPCGTIIATESGHGRPPTNELPTHSRVSHPGRHATPLHNRHHHCCSSRYRPCNLITLSILAPAPHP
jgi:hypothetical protein